MTTTLEKHFRWASSCLSSLAFTEAGDYAASLSIRSGGTGIAGPRVPLPAPLLQPAGCAALRFMTQSLGLLPTQRA